MLETPFEGTPDLFFVEYGHADVTITKVNSHVDRLFAGLGDGIPVFMSHFDKLINLPEASDIHPNFSITSLTVAGLCGNCCHQELRVRRHRPRGEARFWLAFP
jgi:hypothetical protein